MVKKIGKISKNSRAARRGLVESEEAKELSKAPKVENDLKKSIIRTTIMNENLLNAKIEKKRTPKKLNNALKSKIEKNSKLQGILDSKINQSVERYKFVKVTRKSGWDKINSELNQDQPPQEEGDDEVRQYKDQNKFSILEETDA